MSDRAEAKKRNQMLWDLRAKHEHTVLKAQAYLKDQQYFRRKMQKAMKGGPKTIPEIAEKSNLPTDQVLWHVMAMKKYDLIREVGMEGEYYQYQLVKEVKQ